MGKPQSSSKISVGESSSSIQQVKSRCKILRNSRYFYSLQRPVTRQTNRTARNPLSPQQLKQRTRRRQKTLKRLNKTFTKSSVRKKANKRKNLKASPPQIVDLLVAESSAQNLESSDVLNNVPQNSVENQKTTEVVNNVDSNTVNNENASTPAAPESSLTNPSAEDPNVNFSDSNPAGRLANIFSESINLGLKQRFSKIMEQNYSSASSSTTRTFIFHAKKDAEDMPSSSFDKKDRNESEREIQNICYSSSYESEKPELRPSPETKVSKSNLNSVDSDHLSASSACMDLHALEFYPVKYDEMYLNL